MGSNTTVPIKALAIAPALSLTEASSEVRMPISSGICRVCPMAPDARAVVQGAPRSGETSNAGDTMPGNIPTHQFRNGGPSSRRRGQRAPAIVVPPSPRLNACCRRSIVPLLRVASCASCASICCCSNGVGWMPMPDVITETSASLALSLRSRSGRRSGS